MRRDGARPEDRWRSRPILADLLRGALLAVPLVSSVVVVYAVGGLVPVDEQRSWWGLTVVLVAAVITAVVTERITSRLLPLTVLLHLTMLFPDRAPSRLRLARAAVVGPPTELVWSGAGAAPTTTSDTVLALMAALGAHDRKTRGHSERVRVLCDVLAGELKLDQGARDRLRWAALLHDVGKMAVSPTVLNKPAALDRAEFGAVKEHPEMGASISAPLLPWLGEWGRGILEHHERYDGSGYPHGLAGSEISAAGRIIALVDSFETMTAARAYKKPLATRAAREELARCSGTQFDPAYVRAFLAVSLPRMMWALGPVSLLVHAPFLRSLAEAGARSSAATGQAAAGAASVAVLATAGLGTLATVTAEPPSASAAPPATTLLLPPSPALPGAPGAPPPSATGGGGGTSPTQLGGAGTAPASGAGAPAGSAADRPAPGHLPEAGALRVDAGSSGTPSGGPSSDSPSGGSTDTDDGSGTGAGAGAGGRGDDRTRGVEAGPARPGTAKPRPAPTADAGPAEPRPVPPRPTPRSTPGPAVVPVPLPPLEPLPLPALPPLPPLPPLAPAERRVSIVQAPDAESAARSATFHLVTAEGLRLQCRDSTAGRGLGGPGAGWTDCGAVVTLSDLRPGQHSFQARSVDADGRTGAVATHTWRVRADAPRGRVRPGPIDGRVEETVEDVVGGAADDAATDVVRHAVRSGLSRRRGRG